jgi:hypothetical protein
MIAIGSFGHISCSGYKSALAPVMQGMIVLIRRVNAFVGFIGSSESIGIPSLVDLASGVGSDSGNNTITVTNGNSYGDDLGDDADSILPLLDYESGEGLIGPTSGRSAMPLCIWRF